MDHIYCSIKDNKLFDG